MKQIRIKKLSTDQNDRISLFVGMLMFAFLCGFCYYNAIAVFFEYTGIQVQLSIYREILAVLAIILLMGFNCFFMPNDYYIFISSMLGIFSCIPTIIVWGVNASISDYAIACSFIYWIAMELVIFIISYKKSGSLKKQSENRVQFHYLRAMPLIMKLITLFSLFMAYRYGSGMRFVSFSDSLDVRLALRETVIPGVIRYPYMILGGAVLPVITSYGLQIKKRWIPVVSVLNSFVLYSVNGMKLWILYQGIAIGLFFLINRKHNFSALTLSKMVTNIGSLIWVIGYIVYKILHNSVILAYMHRAFTLLSDITYYNIDFFSTHENLMLRDSIMRFMFPSPYPMLGSQLIGKYYYNSTTMNATNGLLSDAYANFGMIGVFIYPVLMGFVIYILVKVIQNDNSAYGYTSIFVLIYQFIGNSFFTSILTGGYLIVILFLYFLKKAKKKRKLYSVLIEEEKNI